MFEFNRQIFGRGVVTVRVLLQVIPKIVHRRSVNLRSLSFSQQSNIRRADGPLQPEVRASSCQCSDFLISYGNISVLRRWVRSTSDGLVNVNMSIVRLWLFNVTHIVHVWGMLGMPTSHIVADLLNSVRSREDPFE